MKWILVILLVVSIAGCVWVGRHGNYTRTDSISQDGTNAANKVQKIEITPK